MPVIEPLLHTRTLRMGGAVCGWLAVLPAVWMDPAS